MKMYKKPLKCGEKKQNSVFELAVRNPDLSHLTAYHKREKIRIHIYFYLKRGYK